jgi:hypothetical protein
MSAEFVRDAAATAAILGFFASSWFGWAQERPPVAWRKVLVAGSIVSLLTTVAGGVLAWQHWSDGTVSMTTPVGSSVSSSASSSPSPRSALRC